jgi:hypothetical protein
MDTWHQRKLAELHARAPKKRQVNKSLRFAHVPLPWGYRVFAIAGKGAPIVLYALHMQKMTGHGEIAITAAVLKEKCGGIDRKTRNRTLNDLEAAGFATVRRRGKKFQGCALLTMHPPEPKKDYRDGSKSDRPLHQLHHKD